MATQIDSCYWWQLKGPRIIHQTEVFRTISPVDKYKVIYSVYQRIDIFVEHRSTKANKRCRVVFILVS